MNSGNALADIFLSICFTVPVKLARALEPNDALSMYIHSLYIESLYKRIW